jgi:hypothetical protein
MVPDYTIWLFIGIVLIGVIFLVVMNGTGCKGRESYTRSDLSQDNSRFKRQPVDYYLDQLQNPHFMADPEQRWQPLEQGPVDLYSSERKLWNGTLFDEFLPDYGGILPVKYYPHDSKTRFDLIRTGDLDAERKIRNSSKPIDMHAFHATTGMEVY